MRIRLSPTMPWEVFAAVSHTRQTQTFIETLCQSKNNLWVTTKRTITNHTTATKIQIEYRRKTKVDTTGA